MKKMGAMNAEDLAKYKGVFVFAQQVDNVLSGISFELIGEGKRLAQQLDTQVTAVLIGSEVSGLVDVDDSNIGLKGSPTKIARASDKVRKGAGEKVVPDSPEDAVSYIVGKLNEKHVI